MPGRVKPNDAGVECSKTQCLHNAVDIFARIEKSGYFGRIFVSTSFS